MININADKTLALLLPNANKALAEVIKSASPQQLKQLAQNSDMKGVLSSLLSETLQGGKSDKVLVDILKNATVFKEMGSFSKDLTQLQTLSKTQTLPQKIEAALTQFLKSMEGVDAKSLKAQVSNSGVFLESKLAMPVDTKAPVKVLLQEIQTLLQKSTVPESKPIEVQLKVLLQEISSKDTKSTLSQDIQKITSQLKALHVRADVIHSKPMQTLMQTLQHSIEPQLAQSKPMDIKALLSQVKEFASVLTQSKNSQSTTALASVEKVISNLQALPQNRPVIKLDTALLQSTQKLIDTLHVSNKESSFKPLNTLLESLQKTIPPQNPLDAKTLMSQIQEMYALVLKSKSPQSSSILGAIEKIVSALRSIEASTPLPQMDVKIPQATQKVLESLQASIKMADPIFSKELVQVSDKLGFFTKPEALSAERVMNERIVHDMKANLLQLGDEIKQTPAMQNSEMAKIVDKLNLQIDYYQLYSHLNNSSSLYFPFVWDQLEEGSLSIKKTKDKKFYCEINLNLKEHGELRVMLALYEENQINIHAFSESEALKNALRENVSMLRETFIEADLTLREVRFFDKDRPQNSAYETHSNDLDMGFEVKV
ncbi:MAG: flagellar hook-length control protein FliK [Campylobacterota bacterium]|nr:flagellar hook-length control protein FliK [Campylobacterota bacterium]